MKKVNEEGISLQRLKNMRIAFIVQTVGIFAFLVYEAIMKGLSAAIGHPLWYVAIFTVLVQSGLDLIKSDDDFKTSNKQIKPWPYYRIVLIAALVGLAFGLLVKFGPDKSSSMDSLISGSVASIAFLLPFTIVHILRIKRG